MRGGRLTAAVLLAAAAWAGCRGGEAADVKAEKTQHLTIFVYDRSMSIPDFTLELAQRLSAQRISTLEHGDRIAALQVLQRSLAEPPKRWSQSVPEREFEDRRVMQDSVSLRRFLRDAADYLASFSDTSDRSHIMGTDILSTFHDVAAEMRAAPEHRATMYIFSDMLQSTPEMNMEGMRRMPGPDWIENAKVRGVLPDLSGLCVVVVGARVDTDPAQRVKAFWQEYFEATGARFLERNYTLRPIRLPEYPC